MRNFTVLFLTLVFAMALMGMKGCNDEPVADDDAVAQPAPPTPDELKAILEAAKMVETDILAAAMNAEHPDFDACMVATGTLCSLDAIIGSIDSVSEEMAAPDGKFTIAGCKFDATIATGTKCESIKPDVWPRVDPAGWADKANTYANLAFNTTEVVLMQSIPSEGEKCKDGNIALASIKATHKLTNNALTQGAQGSFIFDVPEASVDYSTCGVLVTE